MSKRLFATAGLFGALALAACGGGPPPSFNLAAADSGRSELVLRPGDVVKIQVFGHDELSGEYPVDENDTLLLPIVGSIATRGMNITELRTRIRREFGQLYTQTFVSITPLFRVAVLGEVMAPGLYSVDPTMTVYDVLARAGGPARDANVGNMRLLRGGRPYAFSLDAEAVARATIRELGVRSGDQFIVPRKSFTGQSAIILISLVNTVLIAISVMR
jgi:polysaccharide export outer membrane protein